MKLSEKLIKLRKEKGLSQEEFGNEINVSRQAVSKWENEEAKPDIDKIKEIVKKFNISYDYLLNDEIDGIEETEQTTKTPEKSEKPLDNNKQKKHKHKTLLKTTLIILLLYLLICTYKFITFYKFYLIANSFKEEDYIISQEITAKQNPLSRITTTKIGNKILQESYPAKNEEAIKDKDGNTLPYSIEYTDTDKKINYYLNYDKDKNIYTYHDRKKDAINDEETEKLFENENIIKEGTLANIPSNFKEIFLAAIDPRYYYVSISNRQYKSISFADDLTIKVKLNNDYLVESVNIKFEDNRGTNTFEYNYDYVQDHFKEREIQDPQEKYKDKILYNEE